MGKKNKPAADHVRNKRKGQNNKSTNPFEVKINRQKQNVLGRKVSKHDKGMPGLSRSKATKKRKATLLKEYEQQFKSNKFVDKRFGENDTSLSLEEKMLKRYALERSKAPTTKNKFNLNEDEELTHYGQSLAEIEKFDEPVISDEEEDDDDDKRAAAKLVAEQHFGGFLKKKSENQMDENKSWKEKMEDIITQSKKAKYERKMEKEEATKMTEDLDAQWKNLHLLINKNKAKRREEDEPRKNFDDYDIAVRQLQFEIKGQATDRLKTEEEMAKDEKERLEKLESDRLRRMKGISDEEAAIKSSFKSADDLDDGFGLEPQLDFDYVSYKDGKLLTDNSAAGDDDDDDDDGEEQEDDDENGDDGDEEEEEKSEDEGSDAESEDDYEDLESDHDEVEEEDKKDGDADIKQTTKSILKARTVDITDEQTEQKKKEMIEKARLELPYTFKAPENYNDLLGILEGHDLENQLIIIQRIRKCHHPSLAEGNKQKLENLFGFLVQFYGDLCIQDPPQMDFINQLITHLYELTQMSPVSAAQMVINNIADRQEEFRQICEKKSGRGLYPALDTLLLFKLVSVLFPTSDYYHHVTTPALVFMSQMLSQCPVNHGRDVVAGLFLCNMCLEYVSMSKRYIPAVVNFLHGLLFLASNKEPNQLEPVIPPFKPVGKNINMLHISATTDSVKCCKWSLSKMLAPEVDPNLFESDTFRVCSVNHCVVLLEEYSKLYAGFPAFKEVFTPVLHICTKLPTEHYPTSLQTTINSFVSRCKGSCERTRTSLVMQKRKPKPLKMFEPQMEESFDGKKKGRRGNRDFNAKQILLHKHKKEMKGARRELKKDTQFLARQKLQEQIDKDMERKRKVKEIFGGLATQEGEYKKMKRGQVSDK